MKWLKCKDCEHSRYIYPMTGPIECKINGQIYSKDHTCHIDEDVREGKTDD
jgi:hypothetical protein